MHELFEQLVRHARGLWRFRWYLMITAWLVCIVGWSMVMRMPDQYQASATVHVDTQTVLRPLLQGLAVNTNSSQRVKLMTRTLLSRPNLEKLSRMTDLDLHADTPEAMESLLDSLSGRIELNTTQKENLYTISFRDSDRNLAKRIVQSLLTIFVESSLGETRKDTDTAQQFLEQQIKQYEAKLNEAEQRLANFKRENVGMMPGEGPDYYSRLQSALNDLDTAKLQLREIQNRRKSILQQLQDLEDEDMSLLPYSDTGATTATDARIQSLQTQLDELLLRFTDKHPDVIELRRLIDNLKEQRKQEAAASAGVAQQSNPLNRQLQMMLAETESQQASIKVRVNEYEQRVEKLKELVDTVPKVEAELKKLNRDYAVHKENYETLLSRREQANISEQVEISADDVKFRVVEPPRVPLSPSGPPRMLYMSAVLLGGLAVGSVVAFVMYQIRPTFDDAKTLKEITGLPVFGSVSMIYTDAYLKRRRVAMVTFSAVGVGLLLAYGLVVGIEMLDLDIIKSLRV